MSTLRELAAKLGNKSVLVRGKEIEVRALTDFESDRLMRLFPVPLAPRTKQDPNAGSLAPKIPDTDEPGYVRAYARWERQRMRLEVAVGAGLTPLTLETDDAAATEQLKTAEDEVSKTLSERELARLFVEIRSLADSTDEAVAREALIVDMRQVKADDLADVAKLPEDYGTTLAYLDLRICERFKMPPWMEIEPGWRAILRANERIRLAQEARKA